MALLTCRPDDFQTGLAAIVNPLDDTEILEFYNTAYGNLGYKTRGVKEDGKTKFTAENFKDVQIDNRGPLLWNAPLVVIHLSNQIQVFGISRFQENNEWRIFQLSPGLESTDASTKYSCLAGTGDGQNGGWLYQKHQEGGQVLIMENAVGSDRNSNTVNVTQIADFSNLAAYYNSDEEQRYVVWQNSLRQICVKGMDNNDDGGRNIAKSQVANEGTPLAGCAIKSVAYIFFITDDAHGKPLLNAVTYDYGKSKAGEIQQLTKAPPPVRNSYITICPDKSLQNIHVFYVNKGDDRRAFAHYVYKI